MLNLPKYLAGAARVLPTEVSKMLSEAQHGVLFMGMQLASAYFVMALTSSGSLGFTLEG
jgi:hypothetical protein